MKLKITLSIILIFLFAACPTKKYDIYVKLNNFHVKTYCANIEDNVKDTLICDGEKFRIYLNFESNKIATSYLIPTQTCVAYDYQQGIFLDNKIKGFKIINTNNLGTNSANTNLNSHFNFCLDNSNWIYDLSVVEGINETVLLQHFKEGISPYFKLKTPISYDGRFIVQLELSDGTVLSDTTQNIVLK